MTFLLGYRPAPPGLSLLYAWRCSPASSRACWRWRVSHRRRTPVTACTGPTQFRPEQDLLRQPRWKRWRRSQHHRRGRRRTTWSGDRRGGGKVYWTNPVGDRISFANLDGSGGGGNLNTTGATVNQPNAAAVYPAAGRIYWTNEFGDRISFANLNNTGGGGNLSHDGRDGERPDRPRGRLCVGKDLLGRRPTREQDLLRQPRRQRRRRPEHRRPRR